MQSERNFFFPANFLTRPSTRRLMKKFPLVVEWWIAIIALARESLHGGKLVLGGEFLGAVDIELIHFNPITPEFVTECIAEGLLTEEEDGAIRVSRWTEYYRSPAKVPQAAAEQKRTERSRKSSDKKKTASDKNNVLKLSEDVRSVSEDVRRCPPLPPDPVPVPVPVTDPDPDPFPDPQPEPEEEDDGPLVGFEQEAVNLLRELDPRARPTTINPKVKALFATPPSKLLSDQPTAWKKLIFSRIEQSVSAVRADLSRPGCDIRYKASISLSRATELIEKDQAATRPTSIYDTDDCVN